MTAPPRTVRNVQHARDIMAETVGAWRAIATDLISGGGLVMCKYESWEPLLWRQAAQRFLRNLAGVAAGVMYATECGGCGAPLAGGLEICLGCENNTKKGG